MRERLKLRRWPELARRRAEEPLAELEERLAELWLRL